MKTIHTLTILDKSTSMSPYQSRTIEGINGNINALKPEVDKDTVILNTLLQFSSTGNTWTNFTPDSDFVFTRVGQPIKTLTDLTVADYVPNGGTPLLDAIGFGIEKIKDFHGDKLGSDDIKILVTVYTDGEENSSKKWKHSEIKKMIEHFESDGRWTFTFVGCGSFDKVSKTSATFGINASNTLAYADTEIGRVDSGTKISTSYVNYARSVKSGTVDKTLFVAKTKTEIVK